MPLWLNKELTLQQIIQTLKTKADDRQIIKSADKIVRCKGTEYKSLYLITQNTAKCKAGTVVICMVTETMVTPW